MWIFNHIQHHLYLLIILFSSIFEYNVVYGLTKCNGNETHAGCFIAAVYEHIRIGDKLDLNVPINVYQMLSSNLDVIQHVAQLASIKGAKILVTPEYSIYPLLVNRQQAKKGFMVKIPDIGSNVCNETDPRYTTLMAHYTPTLYTHQLGEAPVSNDKLLKQIACIAKRNQLYLAMSVPELDICAGTSGCSEDGFNLYNALVVFDSNGTLIAKYRKHHLFSEPAMSPSNQPEVITFDTEFGRFGMLTCFDIMFKQPLSDLVKQKHIDHLIFSTAWFDELPLLTGLAFHSGNAYHYHINMLSANLRRLSNGSFGSAIISSQHGTKIQTEFGNHNRLLLAALNIPCQHDSIIDNRFNSNDTIVINEFDSKDDETSVMTMPEEHDEVVIVDNSSESDWIDRSEGDSIPSINHDCSYVEPVSIAERVYRQHSYLLENNYRFEQYHYLENQLSEYKHKRIETTFGQISRLCDDSVCCSLSWRMNPRFNFASDDYYLVALNRLRTKTTYPWYEQACAVISYSQMQSKFKLTASTHFDRIRLTGWFDNNQTFPSLLSSRLHLVPSRQWQFIQSNNTAQMIVQDLHQPLAFATIYTRVYSGDRV